MDAEASGVPSKFKYTKTGLEGKHTICYNIVYFFYYYYYIMIIVIIVLIIILHCKEFNRTSRGRFRIVSHFVVDQDVL